MTPLIFATALGVAGVVTALGGVFVAARYKRAILGGAIIVLGVVALMLGAEGLFEANGYTGLP